MSIFNLYLKLGINHIADIHAYDHIVFLIALCGVYLLREFKSILILITAFTIGHTTTLALATLNLIVINRGLVEFLIPVTILLTSAFNVLKANDSKSKFSKRIKYTSALIFGLIHGMGFSSYLKELLGASSQLLTPLLAFNIGVELGQLLIVSVILIIASLVVIVFSVKHLYWNIFLSGISFSIALVLAIQRIPL